jgi:hypothetical protein
MSSLTAPPRQPPYHPERELSPRWFAVIGVAEAVTAIAGAVAAIAALLHYLL